MQFFTERGASHKEVLEQIRLKYGERAKIMASRSVQIGGFLGLFRREGVEYSGYLPQFSESEQQERDAKSRAEILTKVGGSSSDSIRTVLEEIRTLKEELGGGKGKLSAFAHPNLERVDRLLRENDFSENFIQGSLDFIKANFSLQDLQEWTAIKKALYQWIAGKIQIFTDENSQTPRVFVLVGATGVGKTTTIAKLAAMYRLGRFDFEPKRVRMITIDNYRIGAQKQIQTYGKIMEIPVECVETFEELRQSLTVGKRDSELILVDTIGKSPRDFMKLAEMHQFLEACGPSKELHLAISATTKSQDIRQILRQFEPYHYQSILLTKLDETFQVGNLISVLDEFGKKISFITDGQEVPRNIGKATADKLLERLAGFDEER